MLTIIKQFINLFNTNQSTTRLEDYVISQNPQDVCDVERAAQRFEFEQTMNRGL